MNIHNIIHFILFTFIFTCTFFLFTSPSIKEANTNQELEITNPTSVLVDASKINEITNKVESLKEKIFSTNTMIEDIKNDEFINIELREKDIGDRQSFIGINLDQFKIVMEKMKDEAGNELPLQFKCILYLPTGNEGPKGPRGEQGPKGIRGPPGERGIEGPSGICN